MFDLSFSACAFFFFLNWRLAREHSLGQDQSTVAHRAETTVAECFLTSFNTMPAQRHSQPTPTSLGQGCMHV